MGLPVLSIKALTAGKGTDARVDDILKLIPNTATEENKLTDKDFVNSSIATETAHYISDDGEPFTSVDDLPTTDVTNNDYAFVTGTDTAGNTYYDRYKATVSGDTVTWAKEYRLNNSSFTAEQWAAIQSGITAALVNKLNNMHGVLVVDYSKLNYNRAEAHAIELAYQAGELILCQIPFYGTAQLGVGILTEFSSRFDTYNSSMSMTFVNVGTGRFNMNNQDSYSVIQYHARAATFSQISMYDRGGWNIGYTSEYANLPTDTTLKNVHPSGDPILGVNPDLVAMQSDLVNAGKVYIQTPATSDYNAMLANFNAGKVCLLITAEKDIFYVARKSTYPVDNLYAYRLFYNFNDYVIPQTFNIDANGRLKVFSGIFYTLRSGGSWTPWQGGSDTGEDKKTLLTLDLIATSVSDTTSRVPHSKAVYDALALKADAADVYAKTEVYNKTESDAALALKADASSVKTATAFTCEMADGTTKTLTMNGVLS